MDVCQLCAHTHTHTHFPSCKLAHVWAALSKNRLVVTLVSEHLEQRGDGSAAAVDAFKTGGADPSEVCD